MSFEEVLSMVFQPGMSDVFFLGACFSLFILIGICIISVFFTFVDALIHRFIYPGKEKNVTQSSDPGAGAAG